MHAVFDAKKKNNGGSRYATLGHEYSGLIQNRRAEVINWA
jgi:hypothetical protein